MYRLIFSFQNFTTLLTQIDGVVCLTQALVLPGVCDFLLRLLSCSIPHAPVYVNPSLVSHLNQIQWSRLLVEGLSPIGEKRRVEWNVIRMFSRWKNRFVYRMIKSLGLSQLYYEYCEQLFIHSNVKTDEVLYGETHLSLPHSTHPTNAACTDEPLICFAGHFEAVQKSIHEARSQLSLRYGISVRDFPEATASLLPELLRDEDFYDFEEFLATRNFLSGPEMSNTTNEFPVLPQFYSEAFLSSGTAGQIAMGQCSPTKDVSIYLIRLLISRLIHFSPKSMSGLSDLIGPPSTSFVPLLSQFAVWCMLSDHFTWTGLLLLLLLHHHVQTRTHHYPVSTPGFHKSRIGRPRSISDPLLHRMVTKAVVSKSRSKSLSYINDPVCDFSEDQCAFWESVNSSGDLITQLASPATWSSLFEAGVCFPPEDDRNIQHKSIYDDQNIQPKSIYDDRRMGNWDAYFYSPVESRPFEVLDVSKRSDVENCVISQKAVELSNSSFVRSTPIIANGFSKSQQPVPPQPISSNGTFQHTPWLIGAMAQKTTVQMIGLVGRLALDEFLSAAHPLSTQQPAHQQFFYSDHPSPISDTCDHYRSTFNSPLDHADEGPKSTVLNFVRMPRNIHPPVDFGRVAEFLIRLLDAAIKPQMLTTAPLMIQMAPPSHPDSPLYTIPVVGDPWSNRSLDESVVPKCVEEASPDRDQLLELKPLLDLLKVIFTRKGFFVSLVYVSITDDNSSLSIFSL